MPEAKDVHPAGTATSPHALDDPLVISGIRQYRTELEAGGRPDRQDLLARYPEIADELAGCLDALEFVQQVAPQLRDQATGIPGDTSQPGDVRPLAALGDFRIEQEIGRGGMGIVYQAEQLSLGRRVALKVLPFAAVLDPKHLQRFKNEARAAASLDHPDIVHVHSVGCERAVHFYAMQYIEGQTLAEVIRERLGVRDEGIGARDQGTGVRGEGSGDRGEGRGEGGERVTGRRSDKVTTPTPTDSPPHPSSVTPSPSPLSPSPQPLSPLPPDTSPLAALSTETSPRDPEFFRTVASLGIQAAEALEHAHQMGVVHRDIKPSNLMVESILPSPARGRGAGGEGGRGDNLHLWITDFGLAMTQTDANLTMTGDLLGTLRYLSPEQVQAKHGVLDHRTDVYSLGLTLYELLTLQPAFPGDDRQKLLRQIIEDDPRPPRQVNHAIPKDLETIVLKATAKEPQNRYSTAQALADDLRRFLEDKPIQARRPSLPARAAKWSHRHRPVVRLAAVMMMVMTIGLTVSTLLISQAYWREEARRQQTEDQRERAEKNLRLALGAVERIYLKYAHDNYLKGGARGGKRITPKVEEFLGEAMDFYEQFARANHDDPSVRLDTAKAWDRVGRVRSSLGMHDEAEEACRRAVETAEKLLSEFPDEARYRDLLCRVHYNRAAAFIESSQFDQAVGEYTQAIDINPRFAWAFHERASAHAKMDRLDQAIGDYTAALRVDPNDHLTYHARGRMYLNKGDFARAIE